MLWYLKQKGLYKLSMWRPHPLLSIYHFPSFIQDILPWITIWWYIMPNHISNDIVGSSLIIEIGNDFWKVHLKCQLFKDASLLLKSAA